MTARPLPSDGPANDGLDAVKIIAMALMAANHALLALPAPWPDIGHLSGRPCLVMFTWLLATRLARGSDDRAVRTLQRLLVWGIVAQPIYLLLVGGVALRLDVLFTLALGVGGLVLWRSGRRIALAMLTVLALAASPWLDGGGFTATAVGVGAVLQARGRPVGALRAVVGLVCAANLLSAPDRPMALLGVIAAIPLILVSRPMGTLVPRLPGWMFYAFYPVHLAIIWLVFGPYR